MKNPKVNVADTSVSRRVCNSHYKCSFLTYPWSVRLSKASKKDAEVLIQEAEDYEKKFKDLLLKKQKWGSLTKAKNLIAEASSKCKELRDEKKEIGVIANKAYSRASTKK